MNWNFILRCLLTAASVMIFTSTKITDESLATENWNLQCPGLPMAAAIMRPRGIFFEKDHAHCI